MQAATDTPICEQAAPAPSDPAVGSTRLVMPGLASMKKAKMQEILESIWGLCNEQRIPKLNGGVKMGLYGRVYTGLVLGLGTTPERYRGYNKEVSESPRKP